MFPLFYFRIYNIFSIRYFNILYIIKLVIKSNAKNIFHLKTSVTHNLYLRDDLYSRETHIHISADDMVGFLEILIIICVNGFQFSSINFHMQRKKPAKYQNLRISSSVENVRENTFMRTFEPYEKFSNLYEDFAVSPH